MSYSLATLWHERQRYLPGVLAVGFSTILIALQCGLLLGLFSITSIPIDHSRADIWVTAPEVLSVDVGRPIPDYYKWRVASQKEVVQYEEYLMMFMYWGKPNGGTELCLVIGCSLQDDSLGAVRELTPELRARLTEPGTVVIDESELDRLGVTGVNDLAEITGQQVRIVGLIRGFKSLAGPFIYCSMETARPLVRYRTEHITYVLAKCRNKADAPAVVERLNQYKTMSAFTTEDFSFRSRMHWLTKTKAGIALGYAALLGLLVGSVVTSQTLYAATAASLRELAVLRALGIPRWRMALSVVSQAFWVGIAGIAFALPAVILLGRGADALGARVLLPPWLLIGSSVVTLTMALFSGLMALRSLRQVEPATLLR